MRNCSIDNAFVVEELQDCGCCMSERSRHNHSDRCHPTNEITGIDSANPGYFAPIAEWFGSIR